jgi:hypothetical protein
MGCCEQGKELFFSITGSEFLDYKEVCQLVKTAQFYEVKNLQ